jgi:hypothetical protein
MNIEELKAKHGRVFTVIVPLDDEENGQTATFYLKKPDGTTRKMISKLAGGSNPEKAVIAGFKALHIGGDAVSILETNEDALISATDALAEILTVQKAIIKKN